MKFSSAAILTRHDAAAQLVSIAAALILSAGCGGPPLVPPPPDTGPQLEALEFSQGLVAPIRLVGQEPRPRPLVERLEHYGVPALSVAVVDGGEIRWAKTWTQVDEAQDIDPETVFQAGSISKLITATLTLRAAQAAGQALDAPLPDSTWGKGVTLAGLLSHTAGVGVAGFAGYGQGEALPDLDQIVRGDPPANHPAINQTTGAGEAWRYSGGGYQRLEGWLQEVTGADFAQLAEQEIFRPLEMGRSTYLEPSAGATAAIGHLADGTPLPGGWRRFPERAAAGLWTTPTDLAAWLIDVQKALAGKPGRRLDRASARSMLQPQTQGGWGLGPQLGGRGHASWFGHLGGNAGYRCLLIGFTSSGHGAVLMSNGDAGVPLIREALTALAELYGWPTFQAVERTAVELPEDRLGALEGRFHLDDLSGVDVEIAQRDGELSISLFGATSSLLAESADHFFDLTEGWELSVLERGEDDRVAAFELRTFPGYIFRATRSPEDF